jgi:hypothetical protein
MFKTLLHFHFKNVNLKKEKCLKKELLFSGIKMEKIPQGTQNYEIPELKEDLDEFLERAKEFIVNLSHSRPNEYLGELRVSHKNGGTFYGLEIPQSESLVTEPVESNGIEFTEKYYRLSGSAATYSYSIPVGKRDVTCVGSGYYGTWDNNYYLFDDAGKPLLGLQNQLLYSGLDEEEGYIWSILGQEVSQEIFNKFIKSLEGDDVHVLHGDLTDFLKSEERQKKSILDLVDRIKDAENLMNRADVIEGLKLEWGNDLFEEAAKIVKGDAEMADIREDLAQEARKRLIHRRRELVDLTK